MKTKTLQEKLVLKKETIASLDTTGLARIKGGNSDEHFKNDIIWHTHPLPCKPVK